MKLTCLMCHVREIFVVYVKIPNTSFNLLVSIVQKDCTIYALSLCVLNLLLRRFKTRAACPGRRSSRTIPKNKTLPLRMIRRNRFLKVNYLMDYLRYNIDVLYRQMFVRYTYTKLRSRGRLVKNRKLFALFYFFK
ncbi:uncharacterized protein LOC107883057 [Acyrthosiphon pisum]|uniref:Uncharacterized protein n=1 Tax=Acyrthosiphon pisum TaxID=7029 RepID=A0A8R2D294_ACYPI|nr:uncharacterized protein LOC107883057 [Acyrthosiphon pisum]|eukprot:XP_016657893.1 PREDICTED: uncharacterized protein LOC107883057 [Acyrthosiphon pisum]